MTLSSKALASLAEADVEALLLAGVRESKTIEYKMSAPGGKDDDRREFLGDISSFANAEGGHILYGVAAQDGVPVSLIGISAADVDATLLRLESMAASGIDSRIPHLAFHPVPLASGRAVIISRIPSSPVAPHMARYQGWQRYFGRNAAGKYPLDAGEIRRIATAAAQATERLAEFHRERLRLIAQRDVPAALEDGPVIAIHVVSLPTWRGATTLDLEALERSDLLPLHTFGGFDRGVTYDGFLAQYPGGDRPKLSYLQVFRQGVLESVGLLRRATSDRVIPGDWYEQSVVRNLPHYTSNLENAGAGPPYVAGVALVAVQGFFVAPSDAWDAPRRAIDRDVLAPPVFEIDHAVQSLDEAAIALKSTFTMFWNAAGYERSPNYSDDGRGAWRPRTRFDY
jgi:Putative DNA-binding domain